MILIADSGSTKTDWVLVKRKTNELTRFSTIGFNPQIVTSEFIEIELKKVETFIKHKADILELYFYGAGCSTNELSGIVKSGIQTILPNAKIQIFHDLLGAVRSTWNGSPAITSILGTGSNCCFFDGKEIKQTKPSLGYLLGDEGSGNALGGRLYKEIIYHNAPKHIIEDFIDEFQLKNVNLVSKLYEQDRPNRYLASFAPFLLKNQNDPFISKLIKIEFQSFVDTHIKSYPNWESLSCHFIGSIAVYFEKELSIILDQSNITLGKVIRKPIDHLLDYHHKY